LRAGKNLPKKDVQKNMPQTILISGASRGIGLEFTRQYLARGELVIAGVRDPENTEDLKRLGESAGGKLHPIALDVGDMSSIQRASEKVRKLTDHLDLLINNAGIYSIRAGAPEAPGVTQELGHLTQGDALTFFRINAIGPILIAQQFLSFLRLAKAPKIVSITSGYGSISENTSGFPYFYAGSKAALNMMTRSLAADLKGDGVTAVVMNPGWVRTRMGGSGAPTLPEQSVAGMIRMIDKLTIKQTGHFLSWDGGEILW
jgi:NAD(P)-dependent dehydrogenase (short-subunit alcohol dehydrogenase family)